MKAHEGFVLILFLTLLPLGMRAQESEPKSPVAQPIEPPVTLNGQGPSLDLQSEKIRSSYLSGGVALAGTFTDNPLLSSTEAVSDFSYLVQPYLNFAHSAPRVDWNVSLGSTLTVHHQISNENQTAEDLRLDLRYRLTPYINLRVSSTFDNTTGLFSALNPATSGSGIGVVEQANNSLLIPFRQRTIQASNLAELNYQFGPKSIVGVRGAYSIMDFPGSSKDLQFGSLYNSRTYSGEAFYNHQVSAKQWVGVTLRTQKLETQPFPGTKVDSCLLFYALNVTPSVTLSFFSGPERFDTPWISGVTNPVRSIRDRQWTPAEGATFNWQGRQTSVLAVFSRQIGDGGGLFSAVTASTAKVQLRRQLDGSREMSFGFAYATNDPLESRQSSPRGFSALFQFQQRLGKSFIARVGYTRNQQDNLNGLGTATANLLWVSVSYDFSRPLGR
jgi:hypothetical protein